MSVHRYDHELEGISKTKYQILAEAFRLQFLTSSGTFHGLKVLCILQRQLIATTYLARAPGDTHSRGALY